MWKSYKAFTKRSDRLELYLLCPAICICCYAMYLWDMAGDLAEHWARLSSLGEDSMYFILHVFPKELGVFMSLMLPSTVAIYDYYLEELFHKNENLNFLRRSCKGRQALMDAVKMDLLLRLGSLALIFWGMVLLECCLLEAIVGFEFRNFISLGIFSWLSRVSIVFTADMLAVTYRRIFPGKLGIVVSAFLASMLIAILSMFIVEYFIVVPFIIVLGILLAAGNLALAKRRWKEGVLDEKSD